MSLFTPRTAFAYPTRISSWYAGHMAKSLRVTATLLKDIDLVIEARDARLPLTSINGAFDGLIGSSWGAKWSDAGALSGAGVGPDANVGSKFAYMSEKGKLRERVVVYTKRDLAEEKYERVGTWARRRDGADGSLSQKHSRNEDRGCCSRIRGLMQISAGSSSWQSVSIYLRTRGSGSGSDAELMSSRCQSQRGDVRGSASTRHRYAQCRQIVPVECLAASWHEEGYAPHFIPSPNAIADPRETLPSLCNAG